MTRLFWLGMHKVLKPTELRNLRLLGVEVFNPPYISPIYDQSADLIQDFDQPTTLPYDVFNKLMAYDFFYRPISREIAEILNAFFDTVIVTISVDWLKAICDVYSGRIIFRTYGQHYSLSDKIIEVGLFSKLLERGDFFIVPFAREAVETEHKWFTDLVYDCVPYQIPDDVFNSSERWGRYGLRQEIATSIPNIQNPYFAANYDKFSTTFPESVFRIYGPQRVVPADVRITGALPRGDFLERLASSSGYYYNYDDNVCYLPPIEMMQLGGPVVCAGGSLLAKFLGRNSPNVASDPDDAKAKLKRLLSGDKEWARELVIGQEATRARYDRGFVDDAFKTVFGRLIASEKAGPLKARGLELRSRSSHQAIEGSIAILMHLDGLFGWVDGVAYAFEGIPRVVDAIVRAMIASGQGCVLTITHRSLPLLFDFFSEAIDSGLLRIRVLRAVDEGDEIALVKAKLSLMLDLDDDATIARVLVPHYYAFPEALVLKKSTALYLPDYFPHLFPGVIFDTSAKKDAENKRVGLAIAHKATAILTNSKYTSDYLAAAGFIDNLKSDKVTVAPLPFLGADRAIKLSVREKKMLLQQLGLRPFLFYPTANRPNKQIEFLLKVYLQLKRKYPKLMLVLTCSLESVPAVAEAASKMDFGGDLIFFPRCSEGVLRWLYAHCEALCLTSTMEGNFPPQMLEALKYEAPIVATRLPTVTELLGVKSELLQLCLPLDREDFLIKLALVLEHREVALQRQREVASLLIEWNSAEQFSARLTSAFIQTDFDQRAFSEVN